MNDSACWCQETRFSPYCCSGLRTPAEVQRICIRFQLIPLLSDHLLLYWNLKWFCLSGAGLSRFSWKEAIKQLWFGIVLCLHTSFCQKLCSNKIYKWWQWVNILSFIHYPMTWANTMHQHSRIQVNLLCWPLCHRSQHWFPEYGGLSSLLSLSYLGFYHDSSWKLLCKSRR